MIVLVSEILVISCFDKIVLTDLASMVHTNLLVLVGALNSLNGQV